MRNIIHLAGHQRLIEGRYGVFLYNHHDKYVGQALELYGEYSEEEVKLFRQILSPEDHVLEVGANIGAHTVPLAQIVNEGWVHAFEPQPVVFQNLCANASLNALENVMAWPYAVGERRGVVNVPSVDYGCEGNFGGISLQEEGEGTAVNLITIDSYAHSIDVSLLKVDVEGMEKQVLDGAVNTIKRCRPYLYVENDRVEKSKELIECCWSFGYRLYWHVVPLYNPENWLNNRDNIYRGIYAVNMLGVPVEAEISLPDGQEVTDSSFNPILSWKK